MNQPVYLDNNSTTRTDPRVVQAMLPYFDTDYGNAGSTSHSFGWTAREAVEEAIDQIASGLGAEPREIVITSGATEAINLALKGVAPSLERRGIHIISCQAEHKAGIDPINRLAKQGWSVTWLKPDSTGQVSAAQVESAMTDQTTLVSLMLANNEIGTIQHVRDIAGLCHSRNILMHTDATQAVGKIGLNVDDLDVDLLSFSAHKFYGPKGIGGLYVRRRDRSLRITPQIEGGGQQRGLRSGTLPVPLIIGMAKALQLALETIESEAARLSNLRDKLELLINQELTGVKLNGHPTQRLPNTLNLTFDGVSGEALMLAMKDVAVSSGSACSASDPEPSHVLRAIGLSDDAARSSLRFSLGRFTTEQDVLFAGRRVVETVSELRKLRRNLNVGL